MNPKAAPPSAGQQAKEEEEDYNKLDKSDTDDELTPHDASDTLLSSVCSSLRLASESMSSWSQIAPIAPPSNQPYMHFPPHSDTSHHPATASASALLVLSYAPMPGAQSSSLSPLQHLMSPPLPPLSHTYHPQLVDQQFKPIPQVILLPGALSNTFPAGSVSSGYVVATPNYSSNHDISPPSSTSPTPILHPTHVLIPCGQHMHTAPTPTTHACNPHTVPSPIPPSVMPTIAPANHALSSPSTSHFIQHGTASPAPPANHAGVDQLQELSEAASHLNVGSTKHKGGCTKNASSAPTKNAALASTKNAAPTQNHYPTWVRNGQI